MTMPVPPTPMCPKTTKVTLTWRVCVEDSTITMESSSISHDVPFGPNFLVQERTELAPIDSGISCVKTCRIDFLKSCGFLQGKIENSACNGVATGTTKFVSIIESEKACEEVVEDVPSSPVNLRRSLSIDSAISITVRIWELQRRTTLFQH